jgi:CspA family cold shock protein
MAKGTVKWFDPKKGFGFVVNKDGADVFVHYTEIECEGFRSLRNGQCVEYEEIQAVKGLQGRKVRVIQIPETADGETPRRAMADSAVSEKS